MMPLKSVIPAFSFSVIPAQAGISNSLPKFTPRNPREVPDWRFAPSGMTPEGVTFATVRRLGMTKFEETA
jgi:hypothetical protein